jgi:ubiquinone/menaquinone biosynthesis C-methylase UbiE
MRYTDATCGDVADVQDADECGGRIERGVSLQVTGERLVPGMLADQLFRQHEARYVFAGSFAADKQVLDVACGSGMGTSYLRDAGANTCIGLDADTDAARFAGATYRKCSFGQCDAKNLCTANDSFDLIVSFETIEHIKDQKSFLLECDRVLKPGGVLICSTPNRTISKWGAGNPFHIKELTTKEFVNLLDPVFSEIRWYGQETRSYPLYVIRTILINLLERVHVAEPLRRLVRWKTTSNKIADEFSANSGSTSQIEPLKASWHLEPTFIIAVGTKRKYIRE